MFADENIIRNKKVLLVTFSDNADLQFAEGVGH